MQQNDIADARPHASLQGIETVRRDNCLLVRDVITTSLEKMLIEKDVDGAVAYVKGMISNLLMNRIDLSLLVITKVTAAGLWRPAKLQTSWVQAQRMLERLHTAVDLSRIKADTAAGFLQRRHVCSKVVTAMTYQYSRH